MILAWRDNWYGVSDDTDTNYHDAEFCTALFIQSLQVLDGVACVVAILQIEFKMEDYNLQGLDGVACVVVVLLQIMN